MNQAMSTTPATMSVEPALQQALTHHRAGRLPEAEAGYRRALELKPDFAEAHNNLGLTLQAQGRLAEAEASYRRVLELQPDWADTHNNLGVTLWDQGRQAEAEASYRRALEIEPDYVEAHNNLGNARRDQGKLPEAEASLRRALALKPDFAEAHNNLGNTLQAQGRRPEAEASFRRALALKPDYAEAHSNLGNALRDQGRFSEAETSLRRALALKPDFPGVHNNLGAALQWQGRLSESEASYRRALALKPDYAEAHNNLGAVLQGQGRLSESEASLRQALELQPDFAEAYSNLGATFNYQGRLSEAEASYRRALEFEPDYEDAFGNLLFALNYHPDKGAQEIFAGYREYDQRFGLPHRSTWRAHANSRQRGRRLKIGYVSPDFRQHAVRHFLEPLLACHDKGVVQVYAYAELQREDAVTARYRGYADQWIATLGLSDAALAERIRADGIDILVDLAGHTAGNRLQVFARKPAPVSVSWLGYGYTTGLTAVDYLLTDAASAPPGSEGLFSETPWRVATPGYVYRPDAGMGAVSLLPGSQRGPITFGTLTRAVRINHRTIRVWSEILKRVPGARLVIDSKDFRDTVMQAALAEKFAAHGISRERLEIGFHSPPWDVLRGMDIGLDCFPHNSGTTLFETLYMGVPYVTLAGRPSVGRLGSSILQGAGHPEWIARSEDEYVEIAVALASDLPRLAVIRAQLRGHMQASPLMDEAGFARKVEAAYREMFEQWASQSAGR